MDFAFIFSSNKSNSSSIETAGSLASTQQDVETAGSLASLLTNDINGGFDAFGSKDIFGSVDFSNAENMDFACASQVETAGSLACSFGDMSGFSAGVSSDSGSCAGADAGAGASCGAGDCGGSFASIC